jgi:hypothetical protein
MGGDALTRRSNLCGPERATVQNRYHLREYEHAVLNMHGCHSARALQNARLLPAHGSRMSYGAHGDYALPWKI